MVMRLLALLPGTMLLEDSHLRVKLPLSLPPAVHDPEGGSRIYQTWKTGQRWDSLVWSTHAGVRLLSGMGAFESEILRGSPS